MATVNRPGRTVQKINHQGVITLEQLKKLLIGIQPDLELRWARHTSNGTEELRDVDLIDEDDQILASPTFKVGAASQTSISTSF